MEISAQENEFRKSKHISSENVKFIVSKHGVANGNSVENYCIQNASDKMLGFLCDYWKLKVQLTPNKMMLHYFLKLISVSNDAKAKMVAEQKFFEKELYFYAEIKKRIQVSGKLINLILVIFLTSSFRVVLEKTNMIICLTF